MLHQHGGDVFTGGLDGHGADLLGRAGHSVDHAGVFILPDGIGAGLAHLQKAVGAVPAHAGHNDAHHVAFHLGGHGGEQRIHRRAVAADLVSRLAGQGIAAAHADHPSLEVCRRHQGQAPVDFVAIFGLPHLHGTELIQPLGVHLGKALWHMLNDDHAGNVLRQPLKDLQRGLGPAGGGTQANDGLVEIHSSQGVAQRRRSNSIRPGCRPGSGHLRAGGHHNLLRQRAQEGILALCAVGLADKVHCAGSQGVKYPQVQTGHQNHRQGMLGQQLT